MGKIALVNPGKDQRFSVQEPLHLGYLAAYLRKHNVEVTIIDELAGDDVERRILEFNPTFVGLTATTPLVNDAYRIAKFCRNKGIKTVMGGVHVSILPNEALEHVDFVVIGEGEEALLCIARQESKERIIKSSNYIKNLDDIPMPARDLLNMEFYKKSKTRTPESYLFFVKKGMTVGAIMSSRGCPYDCIFCHNTWRDVPFRFHSAERVISEIKELINIYKTDAIFFIEDDFWANKKRLREICEKIIHENLSFIWAANARVTDLSEELLVLAKMAGCRQITFGFESGSQKILDILNKKSKVEDNYNAVKLCNKIGIIPQGTLMLGAPNETVDDIKATQCFIRDTKIQSVGICLTTPYPGTKLWNMLKAEGKIPDKIDWCEFTYDKTPIRVCYSIPPEMLKKLYKETYEIAFQNRIVAELTLMYYFMKMISQPCYCVKRIIFYIKSPAQIFYFVRRLYNSFFNN